MIARGINRTNGNELCLVSITTWLFGSLNVYCCFLPACSYHYTGGGLKMVCSFFFSSNENLWTMCITLHRAALLFSCQFSSIAPLYFRSKNGLLIWNRCSYTPSLTADVVSGNNNGHMGGVFGGASVWLRHLLGVISGMRHKYCTDTCSGSWGTQTQDIQTPELTVLADGDAGLYNDLVFSLYKCSTEFLPPWTLNVTIL